MATEKREDEVYEDQTQVPIPERKDIITEIARIYLKDINFHEHKFSRSLILANIYFRELALIREN